MMPKAEFYSVSSVLLAVTLILILTDPPVEAMIAAGMLAAWVCKEIG